MELHGDRLFAHGVYRAVLGVMGATWLPTAGRVAERCRPVRTHARAPLDARRSGRQKLDGTCRALTRR
ncbi:hypothetical protein LILAB_23555 [Corallococcus macrosporus]|uniref:Uncharacterized protein n=1 Tax=Myxococcus fulvus (strain ATCC BAA-855 / HW-1) TaxID=483219 RepID=F8CMY4_MYXFH|nr:hypothetical protein LILAB_23555 [Corallococcus macrosporus]